VTLAGGEPEMTGGLLAAAYVTVLKIMQARNASTAKFP
jgi:hypothetical protein